ncbi:MAG TPA: IS66 family transposase, partial [Fimbriiglobus sp.]
ALRREFDAYRRTAEARIAKLEAVVEQLTRQGKRPAAPFRKQEQPSGSAKRPGRKKGNRHGLHRHRAKPEHVDEVIAVPLPDGCPNCRGRDLVETHTATQYQTEIPQTILVRQFDVAVGRCAGCDRTVQGRHPLQTSSAVGAAGSQFGPNVHAAVAILNKELGLSLGKCTRLLGLLFDGLTIARATVYRSMARTAKRVAPAFERIQRDVRGSPVVAPDETSWRVGGRKSWLHVFVGTRSTVYHIDPTRSFEPIRNVLGDDWSGWLVRDGWSPYDRLAHAKHQMCLQHIQRRCRTILESVRGRAAALPHAVLGLIDRAFAIRRAWRGHRLDTNGRVDAAARLMDDWTDTLTGTFTHEPNRTLAQHLLDHSPLDWFGFLLHPSVPATNARAEQAIRPAVVNRKVWGGNRTETGAHVQSVLMSVLRTCTQRLLEPFQYLKNALCAPKPILVPVGR